MLNDGNDSYPNSSSSDKWLVGNMHANNQRPHHDHSSIDKCQVRSSKYSYYYYTRQYSLITPPTA